MAIDDETFYNVLGEEISRSNLVQEMINYYQLKREVGETKVTDFNEGSEVRNLLEAIAVDNYIIMENENELTKIAFIETSEGEYLDKHGASPFIRLERNLGTEAEGYVTFTVPEATLEDISIPEGTVLVAEETGLEYATENEGIISVGETSVTVFCTCLTEGEEGNCAVGEINLIDDDYIDITGLTVTNAEKFTGGTDYEEDDEYRERLLAYVQRDDFGSLPYYYNLAESVEGVHDVQLINATGFTKKILVNGVTKETPNTVLLDVLEAFTETLNIVVGHTFTVDKPDYDEINLDVNLTVDTEISETLIKSVLQLFFDGGDTEIIGISFDGLNIGDSLTKTKLHDALSTLEDIQSIEVLEHTSQEEIIEIEPTDTHTVFKLGDVDITQTVAE